MISIFLPLVTDRLILREIAGDDTFAFTKIATHPRLLKKIIVKGEEKNMSIYTPLENGVDEFINLAISARRENPRMTYGLAVVEKTSNKVIGHVELSVNDLGDTELNACIHPDAQNQGFGSEAAWALCSHAFQRGTQAITATIRGEQKASRALLKKLGMNVIGFTPKAPNEPIREYWAVERIPFLVTQYSVQQKTAASAAV